MRKSRPGWALAVIALLAAMNLAAFAQNPPGGERRGERRGERVMGLARMPIARLDAAVGLTADQKAKIKAIQDKYQADVRALRPAPGSEPSAEARQKRAERTRQANQEIMAVLTTAQKEKLQGALREMAPLRRSGLSPELAAELKLTDAQKRQIATITKETRERIGALSPEERRTRGREIAREAREKITSLLTPDQKAVLEKRSQERRRTRRANPGGA